MKPELKINKKKYGKWMVELRIDHQTFYLEPSENTKAMAGWYKGCLVAAFKRLEKKTIAETTDIMIRNFNYNAKDFKKGSGTI